MASQGDLSSRRQLPPDRPLEDDLERFEGLTGEGFPVGDQEVRQDARPEPVLRGEGEGRPPRIGSRQDFEEVFLHRLVMMPVFLFPCSR